MPLPKSDNLLVLNASDSRIRALLEDTQAASTRDPVQLTDGRKGRVNNSDSQADRIVVCCTVKMQI